MALNIHGSEHFTLSAQEYLEQNRKLKIPAADGSVKTWNKNFVIFDETDTINIVKEAIKSLDLIKIYIPKTIRYRISEAK